ncbi:hypothetical protein A2617_01415 [Candidatus Daviesbacteria bacterium RIFOXYD1_FULL_41_10]|uniref:Uncharacterized protein n=2 Tax=Candidatus Daviesiibacteriota TaxID=1752718 RepID=A0A1F5N0I0_9BACT|nr:MAG: hypothetical protein UU67_C0008G0027 [Candidatus Daviesbacteria bacterium GW2011_GWB1_41_5]OGE71169.1 MAG: hypothetical protein A2617_01415 [Candidatus Daviesbacteria bacterium RIFOXYD1_FULL_41_10]
MAGETLSPLEQADQYLRRNVENNEELIVVFGFDDLPDQFFMYSRSPMTRGFTMVRELQKVYDEIATCEGAGIKCTSDILLLEKCAPFVRKAHAAIVATGGHNTYNLLHALRTLLQV